MDYRPEPGASEAFERWLHSQLLGAPRAVPELSGREKQQQ